MRAFLRGGGLAIEILGSSGLEVVWVEGSVPAATIGGCGSEEIFG